MDKELKNDWLIANMKSPKSTIGDFIQMGLSNDNTELLSKESYLNNDQIKSTFTNNTGDFDEEGFSNFYEENVATFNQFSKGLADTTILSKDYFSDGNTYVDLDKRRLTKNVTFSKVKNPFETVKGVEGLRHNTASELSIRELGQKNKVFNPETGKYENYSPNEMAFWKTTFMKPLALATYDEDGEHYDPFLGKTINHKKGEFKYNEDGKFHYEVLGSRSSYGKDVLNPWDVLTIDGSTADKFNFMSSDDKDKSILGTTLKNVATIVPHFIPGAGQIYTYATLSKALVFDILPVLSKSVAGVLLNESVNNSEFIKTMNRLQARGKALTLSTSDASKESMFNYENLGTMIGDVFGQLSQQRAIAKIPLWLGAKGKEVRALSMIDDPIQNNALRTKLATATSRSQREGILREFVKHDTKIQNVLNDLDKLSSITGKNLGISYMAAMSAVGIHEEAKMQGLDDRDAGLLYLGLLGGLSTLMTKADFTQWALKGIGLDDVGIFLKKASAERLKEIAPTTERLVNKGVKNVAAKAVEESTETIQKSKIVNLVSKGRALGEKIGKQFDKLAEGDYSAIGTKALAESLEEMSEEAISDATKAMYNGLSALGMTSTKNAESFDIFDDVIARYAMAAAGGAAGGAIVGIQDKIGGRVHSSLPPSLTTELTSIVSHGYANAYREKLKRLKDDGKLGSVNLTAMVDEDTPFQFTDGPNFKPVDKTKGDLSQNELAYNILTAQLDFIEKAMKQEGLDTIMDDAPIYNYRESRLLEFKNTTHLQRDIDSKLDSIVRIKGQIADIEGGIKDGTKVETEENKKEIFKLNTELKTVKQELHDILSGKTFNEYLGQALFNTQPRLYETFGVKSEEDLSIDIFGRPKNDLNDDELKTLEDAYADYEKYEKHAQAEQAYSLFKTRQGQVNNHIESLRHYAELRAELLKNDLDLDSTLRLLQNISSVEGLEKLNLMPHQESQMLIRNEVSRDPNLQDEDATQLEYLRSFVDVLKRMKYVDPF